MVNKIDNGFYAIIIILILIIILVLISYPKNCHTDLECFTQASVKCSKAKIAYSMEGDVYTYTIKGERGDKCMATVFFEQASETRTQNYKDLLEGKGMFCEVPLEKITGPYFEVESLNDHCSGPLKEAFMTITIEKLYGIVVQNVGQISQEMKKAIRK